MRTVHGRSSSPASDSPRPRYGRRHSGAPSGSSPTASGRRGRWSPRRTRGCAPYTCGPRTRRAVTRASWRSWCMHRSTERGVALVAVTMAVAVLSAVGLGMAVTAATGDRLATNALAVMQAEALARSGVAGARAALVDASGVEAVDTLEAPWLRALPPQALGAGLIQVEVEDEARRLDPNLVPDALPRLLARLGLDPLLADALLDWSDADDVARPHGAEHRWYESQRPPREPANRPLATVGELLLVRGIDARVLEQLRPFLTTT